LHQQKLLLTKAKI